MLQIMFDLAEDLLRRTENNHARGLEQLNTREGQYKIREHLAFIAEELFEARNVLKIRPWVKTEMPADIDHFLEELMDALMQFMILFRKLDMTPEQVFDYYIRKYLVNKFRWETGY